MGKGNYKTDFEMLSNGQIMVEYGSKYMISVNPALGIHKVRISLVELKTGGEKHHDIYLSTWEFMVFCDDIDKYIAQKKFLADTGDYPTAYKWVKGVGGSNILAIGGGQKGVRFQTTKNPTEEEKALGKKSQYMICATTYEALKKMSFYFKLITGLTTVEEGSYWHTLKKAYFEGVAGRNLKPSYDEITDGDYIPPAEEEKPKDEPKPETKKETETESKAEAKAETESKPKNEPAPFKAKDVTYYFKSTGKFEERQGHYFIPVVVEETGELGTLCFPKKIVAVLDVFGDIKATVDSGESFRIRLLALQQKSDQFVCKELV